MSPSGKPNLHTVNVPITGFSEPVTVYVSRDFADFPEGLILLAPDTRHIEALAAIDRGANVHGPLVEEFFACRDGDSDYNWTVLWVTFNADQAQDSVQRLEPYCMLRAGWQPDDIDDDMASILDHFDAIELEGGVLLWAYARNVGRTRGEEILTQASVVGGMLTASAAELIVRAGESGLPLDFSLVDRGDD